MSGCSEGSTGSGRLQPSMPRMRPTWKLSPEFDGADEGLLARGPEPTPRTNPGPLGRLEEFF